MASTKPNKPNKRIVLVSGDKGGVGKSTIARALAEFLTERNVPLIAFDGDDTNPTFMRFWGQDNTRRLHSRSAKGFEPLINNLEANEPVQLVDLGAGTSLALAQFADDSNFVSLTAEYGGRVTFFFALAPSADSLYLLKLLLDRYADVADVVVARSEAIPGAWELWEGSKTRARLKEINGIELVIPKLDPDAFSYADRESLSWGKAGESKAIPLVSRSYIKRWRQKVFAEFEKAVPVLIP